MYLVFSCKIHVTLQSILKLQVCSNVKYYIIIKMYQIYI